MGNLLNPFISFPATGGGAPLGDVRNLNDWLSTDEVNSLSFTVSAGTNRYLIGIVNHEGPSSGVGGATAATWNGKSMTLIAGNIRAIGGWNNTSIWGLKESDIGDTDLSGTFACTISTPDTPSLAMTSFEGVNQTTPIKDSGTDNANNLSIADLTIATDDMIIVSYNSTSGNNITSWTELIATPDSTFGENLDDDPSEGAYKVYTGGGTTENGEVGIDGGAFNRKVMACVILGHD